KAYGPSSEYVDWVASSVTVQFADTTRNVPMLKLLAISPAYGATVDTTSPIFCWHVLPEAARHYFQLGLGNSSTQIETANLGGTTNCYTTAKVLQNGSQYRWFISAYDQYGNWIGSKSGWLTIDLSPPLIRE